MKAIFIIFLLFSAFTATAKAQEEIFYIDSAKVYLLGNVANSSALSFGEKLSPLQAVLESALNFREGMTLTQAIEESGGLRWNKKKLKVYIYRLNPETKNRQIIKTDLDKVKSGRIENLKLQPNDLIEIECPKKKSCYRGSYFL